MPFISRRKSVKGEPLAYIFIRHYEGKGPERVGRNCYIGKADPSLSNNDIIKKERAKLFTSIF